MTATKLFPSRHLLTGTSLPWFFFCILIQIGTNLHNDYSDFIRGADTSARVGQARATQKGWLTPQQTSMASTSCLILALAVGLSLVPPQPDPVYYFIVASSCFNAVAYTGGPFPLGYVGLGNVSIAYWGLGDVFCFLYFGLVGVLTIPYLVIRQQDNSSSLRDLLSSRQIDWTQALPAAFLSTAIIVVNNLRDRHTDVLANKRTLAVRFGALFCKLEYTILVFLSYLLLLREIRIWAYLPLLTLSFAILCVRAMWVLDGADLNPYVGKTAMLELLYCTLQSFGMFLLASR
jgi:1,4-dihydroxy-2-naphthoate octaprenyltransferase